MKLEFDNFSPGTILVREFKAGEPIPETIQVRFYPENSTIRLSGFPSQYFNAPGAGEVLIGTFPTPPPGVPQTEIMAGIGSSKGPVIKMPIKIKAPAA
jgi:hypothetical protein